MSSSVVRPADGDAYYNRATLRRQTPARNHVEALRDALYAAGESLARVPLNFALGKELEDLGEYDAAFDHVAAGAAQRRRLLSYRVENDEQTIEQIIRTFDAALGDAGPQPGTTPRVRSSSWACRAAAPHWWSGSSAGTARLRASAKSTNCRSP